MTYPNVPASQPATTTVIETVAGSLPVSQQTDIQWALNQFNHLRPRYKLNRDYYDGAHRLAFASEKLSSAFGKLFKAFSDNLTPSIVETLKDRLTLTGFSIVGVDESEKSTTQTRMDEIWRRNRLRVRANQVHLDALIEGDAYVIIWPDRDNFPVFSPNCAPNIVIQYDEEQPGYIIKAAKCYIDVEDRCRLTLYYRDRIEKYITRNKVNGSLPDRASLFTRYLKDPEWPIPNPYDKVPVFHFANRGSVGQLGTAEHSEAIPIQDALNKSVADMMVASEFYGMPQRWATGVEEMTAEEARKKYPLLAGGVWGTTNKDVQFGNFTPADISKYIEISETFRKEMARVSRTPLHYFSLGTSLPSGEALKTAEAPLIKKALDRCDTFGAIWSDAMRFALQVANAGDHEPETKWDSVETRDADAEVNRAAVKHESVGVPVEQLWKELGYTEKQIEMMRELAEKEAEQMMQRQQALADTRGTMVAAKRKGRGQDEPVNGGGMVQ
jgi:hypothetical protein